MKEIVRTVRLKVFVSSDGKEFTSRSLCDKHERSLRDKQDKMFARHRYLVGQISYLKMSSLPNAHKMYMDSMRELHEELGKRRCPRSRITERYEAYRKAHSSRETLEKLIGTFKGYRYELAELGGVLFQNRGRTPKEESK